MYKINETDSRFKVALCYDGSLQLCYQFLDLLSDLRLIKLYIYYNTTPYHNI